MMTIEVECAKCEVVFSVDDFDETKEIEDTTCPECGAELEISEFDPVTKNYSIEDVTGKKPTAAEPEEEFEEDEEEPEDFGIVNGDPEEDEEEEG